MTRSLALILIVGLTGITALPAAAHKGKLPPDALTLVRQASALLAQDPAMLGEVRERLQAALKSKKTEGVHMEQVAEAWRALERKDIPQARRLLMVSIMPAGMPMPPQGPTRQSAGRPPEPSRAPVTPLPPRSVAPPSVETAMQMAEPLRVRFTGSLTELIFLLIGGALLLTGAVALYRAEVPR